MELANGHRNYWKGMAAGLVAWVVLSALLLMKSSMSLMPELDPIQMLGNMFGGGSRTVGWIVHFIIGTIVWGLLFTAIFGRARDGFWWRGIVFALGPWLIMEIVLMPMAGKGLFGLNVGMMGWIMPLVMHVIYGVVLGGVYGVLLKHEPEPASHPMKG